ncbi:MAG: hypothetical protein GWM90_12355, partial [Gemmatimonadetes bacterium]|nr:hypothetical protein [Gemmatimonadota bacterium]NIR37133.1 hypothetical protein [Actinomycetota bacterium]NIU75015.1 hypothetical protein [Gammaproteobacteria bacterium]NIQ54816.1 hypothetical protein [Gemmatimonadota bacterium]NIX44879.1 hypothetical protein [Gemmatimonadota bacterium]
PRRLTPTEGIQYAESDPAWSPDGTRVVFWSYGYGIATVSVGGGWPATMFMEFPTVAYGAKPVWSPDGVSVAFTARVGDGRQIWTRAGDR